MNCQEALNLLYEIIDKEASQIDAKEVQKHLDCCPDCLKKFQIEESLQALVKEKLKAASDIPKIDHLKSKILFQLGQIDVTITHSRPMSVPFRIPAVALAAAAAVIIFIGAAFWGKGLYDHYTEYIPLERAHWAAADDINSFANHQSTQVVLADLGGDFKLTFQDNLKGFSLVGARTEEIKGQMVPHFVYKNGSQTVSTFVFPYDKYVLPEDLLKTRVEINGECHFDHNCRGCRLVFYKAGDAMIITATTDHAFDLLDFNPAAGII